MEVSFCIYGHSSSDSVVMTEVDRLKEELLQVRAENERLKKENSADGARKYGWDELAVMAVVFITIVAIAVSL